MKMTKVAVGHSYLMFDKSISYQMSFYYECFLSQTHLMLPVHIIYIQYVF